MAEAQDPILWEYINPNDVDIPLCAFQHSLKERMAMYLNKDVVIMTADNLCPNWGGLAELIGFDGIETGDIGRSRSPGREVIDRWTGRIDLQPTVGNLIRHLLTLDRTDILTDLKADIRTQIDFHRNRHDHFNNMEKPVQDEEVSSAEMENKYNRILTIDDTITSIAIYDAFVCYDIKDLNFVREMIQRLEDPNTHGFKLFVPGRNNLVGSNSYQMMTRIISERCRHMIVVLSNNFIRSEVCNFQQSYAFALSPGARDKKMVPIKIDDCPKPETLRIMACCDFTNDDVRDWSWNRLAGSILRPMPNKEFIGPLASNSNNSCVQNEPQPSASHMSLPSSGHIRTDSGYVSGFSSGLNRSAPEAASSSSRQDTSALGEPSSSQESQSNVRSNVSKAFKRITNFASSPKGKKKGKNGDG